MELSIALNLPTLSDTAGVTIPPPPVTRNVIVDTDGNVITDTDSNKITDTE